MKVKLKELLQFIILIIAVLFILAIALILIMLGNDIITPGQAVKYGVCVLAALAISMYIGEIYYDSKN